MVVCAGFEPSDSAPSMKALAPSTLCVDRVFPMLEQAPASENIHTNRLCLFPYLRRV
jgi:hypothetical protein